MPVKITADKELLITPSTEWQTLRLSKPVKAITIDRNVYIDLIY
jgi:hypothetical protein